MADEIVIPEDLRTKYDKAVAVVKAAEEEGIDFNGKPLPAVCHAWAKSEIERIERIARSEQQLATVTAERDRLAGMSIAKEAQDSGIQAIAFCRLTKAAARLDITHWALRDWVRKGKVSYRRRGTLIEIPESEISRLLDEQRVMERAL